MRSMWRAVMALGLMGLGCGDDDSADGLEGDMGVTMDAAVDMGTDSGPPDLGTSGDGNDSFDQAQAVTLGEPVEGAIIDPAGDHDFYSFTGEAGQWIIVSTDANPEDDPEMIDTVLTLYDGTMTQIAENDDSVPRFNTDSEIVTRLPGAGTYYVEVQEFSDWADETPEGMPSFTYDLLIAEVNPSAAGVTVEGEPGDDVASAQMLRYSLSTTGDFGLLLGDFRDDVDVDVFSFSVTAAKPFPEFVALPAGAEGNGSTAFPGTMWVTDSTGAPIIGRVDPAALNELSPALPAGEYRLWVDHGSPAGANDFYVLKAFRYASDNPLEMNEALNDLAATADAITLADEDGDGTSNGFILANVGDGDTDHFSFDVTTGDVVSVFCGSRTAGSGVIGLEAAITDVTGVTVVESAAETATDAVTIRELDLGAEGTYLLRLTKSAQDPEVVGDWVRCGVAVGPPAA